MTIQKVIKHGNSLAVVIPSPACQALAIKRGDLIIMAVQSNGILTIDTHPFKHLPEKVQLLYQEQKKVIHGTKH